MKAKKKIIILSTLSIVVVFIVIYLSVSVYYQYHFFKGTNINGIDCSYMSVDKVIKSLEDEVRTYYLQIIERNNTIEHVTAEDIGLEIDIEGNVTELLQNQNSYLWFLSNENKFSIKTTITYDEASLNDKLMFLNCLNPEKMIKPTPPNITYIDGAYSISTADPGTETDVSKLKKLIINAVEKLDTELNLEKEGCYLVSSADNENVYTDLLDTLNKYVNVKITLTFNDELENIVIDSSNINEWLSVNENLEIVFDKEAIETFVGNISNDIETMGQTRKFTNSYGNEISISGGDYGWWISESKEAEAIINNIKSMKDIERDINYLQTAATHGESDLGNTYIEINLLKQRLFCYKDGELLSECDIISGSNKNPTPIGIYRMRFMFKDYTFKRSYFNKTVSHWMVFYGSSADDNIGIASCDWRNDFGGNTYLNNGSYGSVYIPSDIAATIYNQIPNDIPVIIYKSN